MFKTITFQTTLSLGASTPQEIIAGDFNGDGITDLFIPTLNFASDGSRSPLLFLAGAADGSFTDVSASLFGGTVQTAVYAARAVVGDFNGDGRPDILVIDSGPDKDPFPGGQNELLLSTPTGMVNASANLPDIVAFSHGAAVGDFNGDGNLDAVVFTLNANNGPNVNSGPAIQLLEGDGHGGFSLTTSALPASYQQAGYNAGSTWGELVDVNGDGLADLIVGTWSASSLPSEVYLNNHGSFANSTPLPLPASGIYDATVVQMVSTDLNGDGIPDLILSITNGGSGSTFYTVPYIQILIGDGQGGFTDQTQTRLPQSLTPSSTAYSWDKFLQLVDVDGDGSLDIVASNESLGLTTVYLNDGHGDFSAVPTTLPSDATPLYRAGATIPYAFAALQNSTLEIISNDLPASRFDDALAKVLHAPTPSNIDPTIDAVASDSESLSAAVKSLLDMAVSTTSVATLSYQFFTGQTPSYAGLDYLLSPTGPNPNNLNSLYYAQFSTINRFINFASNLGKIGEGAAAFQANYGSLSLADATTKAYTAIFGVAPTADKVGHLLYDLVPDGLGGTYEREDYFASYGLDGLDGQGTKAAMVGWLLGQAAAADIGTFQTANLAYLTDVALGRVSGSVDLVGLYHGVPYTGG